MQKIVSREKVINGIDASPLQTAINLEILSGLYYHLFGEYFDTVSKPKMKHNLSKYNKEFLILQPILSNTVSTLKKYEYIKKVK